MRVLVLGGEGMLGHKVFEVLSRRFDTAATFLDPEGPWREFPQYAGVPEARLFAGVDALRFETVAAAVEQARPDAVVNCVGIIKQLKEASDPVLTITLNSLLPHRLAALCTERGARLVQMSTDCVFSGRKGRLHRGRPARSRRSVRPQQAPRRGRPARLPHDPHLHLRARLPKAGRAPRVVSEQSRRACQGVSQRHLQRLPDAGAGAHHRRPAQ